MSRAPSKADYAPYRADTDESALATLLSRAFAFSSADVGPWIARAGAENVRVARDGSTPVGCLLLIPMGQWFGGRVVPMMGIAGVAVAAERRGRGTAAKLMSGALAEMRRSGHCLSTLYASTQTLYRSVGYEPAGARFEISVPTASIRLDAREPDVRPFEERDLPRLKEVYRDRARASSGHLERGDYMWGRIFKLRGEAANAYVVETKGRRGARTIDGYASAIQQRTADLHFDLRCTDFVASTARAAQRLLAFFADHRSMADNVSWFGGPSDPLLSLLDERKYTVKLHHPWMLRIVDVARALEARGYPPGLTADVELEVRDPLLEKNSGRYLLRVAGGRGTVRRGGSGAIALEIRGLAPLYTGHMSARSLRSIGMLDGPDDALDLAGTVFGGAAPHMPDMF